MNNPIYFIDPDGRAPDDWKRNINGQVVYDKTLTSTSPLGFGETYLGKTHEDVSWGAFGPYTHNYYQENGNIVSFDDSIYNIGKQEDNSLSELGSLFQNTGDTAVVIGTIMCLTGVGAPFGAGLITYGGYASIAGTAMELKDDHNKGTLTFEKAITKVAMEAIPEVGGAAFKALGSPSAAKVLNVEVIGVDKSIDAMRETKSGPYREN
jgi:hypothetical protein